MYSYLTRVFESYGEGSVGDFVADHVKFWSEDHEGEPQYNIDLTAWLAPYDLGISQEVQLKAIPTGEHNIYKIEVVINRLSGDVASWKRINRGFFECVEKAIPGLAHNSGRYEVQLCRRRTPGFVWRSRGNSITRRFCEFPSGRQFWQRTNQEIQKKQKRI